MAKLVLENAQMFKKSVDAIAVLIDEAEFVLDLNGFSLKATDPSQISMVDFSLPKSAFKEFVVDSVQKIGVDLDYLSQVMSRSKAKDSLVLELDLENGRLGVQFVGTSTRTFSIPLIDVSSTELPNPKIDFDAELKLKGEVLQDALKDAQLISTHVTLGVTESCFYVKASSSKGELNNISNKDDAEMLDFRVKTECKSMYPLDYLQDMLKTASSSDVVELSLKSNAPVTISYRIGDAVITYFLAPRIETE